MAGAAIHEASANSRPLYQVRDWNKHFENAQSRRVERPRWVSLPNKHDGKSFRRLMQMPDGPAIYCAWVLIVQIASKCPNRGTLSDDDGPLDARDMSDKTGCPVFTFEKALEVLVLPEIGWLEVVSSRSVLGARYDWKGREGKGIEGEGITHTPPPPSPGGESASSPSLDPETDQAGPAKDLGDCGPETGPGCNPETGSATSGRGPEKGLAALEDFQAEALYMAYPKHVGRADALRAINRALKRAPFEILMEAVQAFAEARKGEDSRYTPHPATWFNQERWTDDRTTWQRRDSSEARAGASREQLRLDNFAREANKFLARHSSDAGGVPAGLDGPRRLEANG